MKIEEISEEELKAEMASKRLSGKYQEAFDRVVKDGVSVKISGLTRGQVAAVYRKAKEVGLVHRTNYAAGYVVIGPSESAE